MLYENGVSYSVSFEQEDQDVINGIHDFCKSAVDEDNYKTLCMIQGLFNHTHKRLGRQCHHVVNLFQRNGEFSLNHKVFNQNRTHFFLSYTAYLNCDSLASNARTGVRYGEFEYITTQMVDKARNQKDLLKAYHTPMLKAVKNLVDTGYDIYKLEVSIPFLNHFVIRHSSLGKRVLQCDFMLNHMDDLPDLQKGNA